MEARRWRMNMNEEANMNEEGKQDEAPKALAAQFKLSHADNGSTFLTVGVFDDCTVGGAVGAMPASQLAAAAQMIGMLMGQLNFAAGVASCHATDGPAVLAEFARRLLGEAAKAAGLELAEGAA